MSLADFQAKHASTLRSDLLEDIQARLRAAGGASPSPPPADRQPSAPATTAAPPIGTVITRRRGGILAAAKQTASKRSASITSTPASQSTARLPKHGEVFYSENGVCNAVHLATFTSCLLQFTTGSPLGTYEQARPNGPGVLATPMVGGGVHQAPLIGGVQPGMVTVVNTQAKRMRGVVCCATGVCSARAYRPWRTHQASGTHPFCSHVWYGHLHTASCVGDMVVMQLLFFVRGCMCCPLVCISCAMLSFCVCFSMQSCPFVCVFLCCVVLWCVFSYAVFSFGVCFPPTAWLHRRPASAAGR